jgi:hypothetical protein
MVQSTSAIFVRARALGLRYHPSVTCLHSWWQQSDHSVAAYRRSHPLLQRSVAIADTMEGFRAELRTATVCIYDNNSKGQTNERASELPVDNAPAKTQTRREKNLPKRATGSLQNTASVLGK